MPRASRSKSSKPVCDVCGRKFNRKYELQRHALTHAPNVEDLKTKCPYDGCNYSTLQRSNITTHVTAVHKKERPHHCTFGHCELAFSDSSSLIRHEKAVHKYWRKTDAPVWKTPSRSRVNKNVKDRLEVASCPSRSTTPSLSSWNTDGSLSPLTFTNSPIPASPSISSSEIDIAAEAPLHIQAAARDEATRRLSSPSPVPYPELSLPPALSLPAEFVQGNSTSHALVLTSAADTLKPDYLYAPTKELLFPMYFDLSVNETQSFSQPFRYDMLPTIPIHQRLYPAEPNLAPFPISKFDIQRNNKAISEATKWLTDFSSSNH